jgi:hypothetical protein
LFPAPPVPNDPTAALRAAVGRLVSRTAHWTPARWAVPVRGGLVRRSRGDEVFALVQRLADLGAEAEGQPARRVPRLDTDLGLGDQLRVLTQDLIAAGPPDALLKAATEAVTSTTAALTRGSPD